MKSTRFRTTRQPDFETMEALFNADTQNPHIHRVDMPYRQTSTWQDLGCKYGIWENDNGTGAWAVYLSPWWNLDFAIHPSLLGSGFLKEIFTWGAAEMQMFATRSGEGFWGSVEFFEDMQGVDQTIKVLEDLGFQPFNWSTVRLEKDLAESPPLPDLPNGYAIRPLRGLAEVDAYVRLHQAAFGSDKMTRDWRERSLKHPFYRPEIDLVVVNPDDQPVGFCVCWVLDGIGQIEPLGVHPDYQGMGLGRALEAAALGVMWEQGAKKIRVDHVSLNEAAIALSLQTGFKQHHNALRYYLDVQPE